MMVLTGLKCNRLNIRLNVMLLVINLQNKLKFARAEILKLEQELVDESMRGMY
jgi:hypothetical protein